MTTTLMTTETLTDEMEVIEMTAASEPEAAQHAGERIARKYRAQGHACECIGVVKVQKAFNIEGDVFARSKDEFGIYHYIRRENHVEQTVYHPVIFPKSIQEDE